MLGLFTDIQANQLYRWVDEKGHVYYSDKVPPQHSKYRRSKLNEQAVTVDIVEEAKTEAQLEREKKLKHLRNAQQRLLDDHQARDRSLLRTFRSEKEIDDTFRAKLSTIEILETVTLSNISRLESQLDSQEKFAADFERKGKSVPDRVIENITGSRRQIGLNQEKIRALGIQKLNLRRKFAADLERFKALVEQNKGTVKRIADNQTTTTGNENNDSIILSVAYCPNRVICDKVWKLARTYLLQHATTDIRIDTDLIIYTSAPAQEDDLSLSLSKINDKSEQQGAQVFLDVRCKQSSIGQELCSSEMVREILASFPPYIETGLKFVAK